MVQAVQEANRAAEACRECGDDEDGAGDEAGKVEGLPCCPPAPPTRRLGNATRCGVKADSTRVLGGVVARPGEFPWHCALLHTEVDTDIAQ